MERLDRHRQTLDHHEVTGADPVVLFPGHERHHQVVTASQCGDHL